MLRGIYSSSSGMEAQRDMQQVIADNLANASTNGFKGARHVYKSYADANLYNSMTGEDIGSMSFGTETYDTAFDFRQGAFRQTDNPLDIAINGAGFLPIQSHDGSVAYTRNGHFTLDANGFIVNQSGEYLLDNGLAPIFIGVENVSDITLLRNGNLSVNGQLITTLNTFEFPEAAPILKKSNDQFVPANPFTQLIPSNQSSSLIDAKLTTLLQGFIETSNVSSIQSSSEMIQVMRSYEANQRAIKVQLDTLNMLMNLGNIQ